MAQLPALPQRLYQQFAPIFGQLSHAQQSAIADVANSVLVKEDTPAKFIELLLRFPEDMHCLTSLVLPHSAKHRVDLVLLLHSASTKLVQTIRDTATQLELARLLELVDCFEGAEFEHMLATMEDLGYRLFMRLLTEYPRPKPCHMCTIQREKDEDYLLVTGLPRPRRAAQIWHADKDEMIQFDFVAQEVLCHGVRVDLANTCHECLDRINRCLADVGRNRELWHLPPGERLKVERQLRKEEEQAAEMFQVLQRSQAFRECRNWIQQVFERVRLRSFRRQQAEQKAAEEKEAAAKEAALAEAKRSLIADAMRSDTLAKAFQAKQLEQRHAEHKALAAVQLHPGFRSRLSADAGGRHPPAKLSFGTVHFTADGVPVTPEAVSSTFGCAALTAPDRSADIAKWKHEAVAVDRKLEIARARKANNDAAEEAAAMRNYVAGRLEMIELKRLVAQSQAVDRQARYLEERRRQKELCRLDRLRALEREENHKMQQEEKLMRAWELAQKHRALEEAELARMRAAEKEQTLVDDFWGIPTLIASLRNDDYDRIHRYEIRVENMRRLMATLGRTKHTRWQPQTDVKVRFTDKLIPYSAETT